MTARITVSVDGEEQFIDEADVSGYRARFHLNGSEVEIEVEYDDD